LKRGLLLLSLGVLAPMLQGALVAHLPRALCPDLSLLIVMALAISWRSTAGGLLVAGIVGFVADLLSSSLLGQHALLHLATFGAAHYASMHVNLKGGLSQMLFAAAWTALYGIGLGALTAFFSPGVPFAWIDAGALLLRALINGAGAPLVAVVVDVVLNRLGEDDSGGRRVLHLEPRKISL
jgi:rod shape-determining protein MreD